MGIILGLHEPKFILYNFQVDSVTPSKNKFHWRPEVVPGMNYVNLQVLILCLFYVCK